MEPANRLMRGLSHLIRWFENRPKSLVLTVGIIVNCVVGALDYVTGYEISFLLFYLIPVALVSRVAGMKEGVFISSLAAVTWFVADLAPGHQYSHPLLPYWKAIARFGFFIIFSSSVVTIKSSINSLKEMARTDPLTGVSNARGFAQMAEAEIERFVRYGRPFSLAYLDVDNFKTVNDTYGHSVGDELLVQFVEILRRNLRRTDILARIGGDEFVVLLPETRPKLAQRVMNRLKETLSKEMQDGDQSVTVSIGLVTFLAPPLSVDEMITQADNVMYVAKSRGKNSLAFVTYPCKESPA